MAFKMYGKSPMMKALIGGQTILEEKAPELAAAIKASPDKMYGDSPKKFASDAQRRAAYASGYKGKKKK
mgnify:CR=1 FL=1